LSLICCVSLVHNCTLFSYYSAKLTKSQKIEPFLQTFLLSDDKKGFTGALKRLFKITKSGNPKPDSHYLLHFQPLEGLPSLSRLNRWLNNVNVFPNKSFSYTLSLSNTTFGVSVLFFCSCPSFTGVGGASSN